MATLMGTQRRCLVPGLVERSYWTDDKRSSTVRVPLPICLVWVRVQQLGSVSRELEQTLHEGRWCGGPKCVWFGQTGTGPVTGQAGLKVETKHGAWDSQRLNICSILNICPPPDSVNGLSKESWIIRSHEHCLWYVQKLIPSIKIPWHTIVARCPNVLMSSSSPKSSDWGADSCKLKAVQKCTRGTDRQTWAAASETAKFHKSRIATDLIVLM
jgi:hypothetical protein